MRTGTMLTRLLLATALTLPGCATTTTSPPPEAAPPPAARPLVVGVSSESPPYAARRQGELIGLEVDFARALAADLDRPLSVMDLRFEDQIAALTSGRIDVIMAGMTVTRARQLRVAFAQPYLRSGLVALMRRDDQARYKNAAAVLRSNVVVGTVVGTTGDMFARDHMETVQVIVYPTAAAATDELRQNRLDLVITDAPIAAWFISLYENEISVLTEALNEEPLAWGVRRDDETLRAELDAALARWRTDGTLDRILDRWVPFWRRLAVR